MLDPLKGMSPAERDEVISGARSFMNDPVIAVVFKKMESDYVDILRREHVGSLTASTAHASIKVLETFKHELSLLVASERINARRR